MTKTNSKSINLMTEKDWEKYYSEYLTHLDNWEIPSYLPCEEKYKKSIQ